jgi:hypothetical protein
MANKFGYLADLAGASFDDATRTSWIHALPLGKYIHPMYGEIDASMERAQRLADSVNNNVRGQQLDIDYDHKVKDGKAAGWVQKAEARADGLWLLVEWTKKAYRAIKEKEYRYFSPEFVDEWQHPATRNVFKDVLFGGGITNRPFLKGILPLNLSELSFAEQQRHNQEESGMDPKLLRKLLGLPEDATDDQVNEAVSKLPDDAVISAPPKEDPPSGDDDKSGAPGDGIETEHQLVAASEGQIEGVIKRLKESDNSEVKALAELLGGVVEQNSKLSTALHLSETARQVQALAEPKDGKQLSAGAIKQLSEVLLAPTADGVKKFAEAVLKGGIVDVKPAAPIDETRRESGNDAVKKFTEAVDKAMKDNDKLQYADAVDKVALEDPQLFAEYRGASYAFTEN